MGCKIFCVGNQKGGVGKTTTSYNLGMGLIFKGKKVLFIDLDPQCDLTDQIGIDFSDESTKDKNILTLLTDNNGTKNVNAVDMIITKGKINIIAGSERAGEAETYIEKKKGNIDHNLSAKLKPLVEQNLFDYIIIDCPPSIETLVRNAIVASTDIIMPIQAEEYAVKDSGKFIRFINSINNELKEIGLPPKKFAGALMTMVDNRVKNAKELEEGVRAELGKAEYTVFETLIHRNSKVSQTLEGNQSIYEFAPNSVGAEDYAKFTLEILGQEGI